MPRECWLHVTFQGEFRIEPMPLAGRTRFAVLWENELLGCYETPAVAAAKLAQGLLCKPSCGLDLRQLDLPPTLSDWAYVPACSPHYAVGVGLDDAHRAAGS